VNAVRIFNEKEVDELVLLDIAATAEGRPPDFQLVSEIASECFMPLAYGGGIRTIDQIRQLFTLGVEKVIINAEAITTPGLVESAAKIFGSQSIAVSIDAKRNVWGKYEVYTVGGRQRTGLSPASAARQMESMGAGEILLTSIDRDGTLAGYDIPLIRQVARTISIPVIACGGAGCVGDFSVAVSEGGASAVAAGSLFVFHGPHRAVLISYPPITDLEQALR
jgi:cyclase